MNETATVVTSIVGSAGVIVTILGLMFRSIKTDLKERHSETNRRIEDSKTQLNTRFDETNRRIEDSEIQLNTRHDDTNRHIEETNRRLERIENRSDSIALEISQLRDWTGKLEGTLSTFIQSQSKVEAA